MGPVRIDGNGCSSVQGESGVAWFHIQPASWLLFLVDKAAKWLLASPSLEAKGQSFKLQSQVFSSRVFASFLIAHGCYALLDLRVQSDGCGVNADDLAAVRSTHHLLTRHRVARSEGKISPRE